MRHVTTTMIENPEADVVQHLEDCTRCRSLIVADVNLAAVRDRVLEEMSSGAVVLRDSGAGGLTWRNRPWVVATVAAAAVALFLAPVAWLGLRSDSDTVGGASTSTSVVPIVELPKTPPEPSPEDAAPPIPTGAGEIPSFEMSFVVGDTVVGRLIWQSPTFYEGLRGNLTDEGATFDYGMYRANDGWGFADPNNVTSMGDGGDDPTQKLPDPTQKLPEDNDIPWGLLIERPSDEVMWQEVAGERVEPTAVEPTHADAMRAWAAEGFRLEVTDDGVPVVVERPGFERFEAVSLNRRALRLGEIGNNTDLPFNYAVFLAPATTDEQRGVLEDGIVTFADYQAAVEAAAECAGVEATFDGVTGMFEFPADGTVGECVDRYVSDIAAVWRVDSQWLEVDELTAISYTVDGLADAVEMVQTERGPERALASGDGWAISISDRGPGYCTRTSIPNSFGDGCFVRSQMSIPDVLAVDGSLEFDGGQLTRGSVLGLVAERADRITIRFSSAAERDIVPGDIVEFGFRGYGILFDASELGRPTEVEVHNGDTTLGIFVIPNPTDNPVTSAGG